MNIPTPITDLRTVEARQINAEINKMICDIDAGTANPQDLINRLHVCAVHLHPIDTKLMEKVYA